MAKVKYTTPKMSAAQRLAAWKSGKCPYCGCTQIRKTEAKDGVRYACLNDAKENRCAAENFFSDKNLLNAEGGN